VPYLSYQEAKDFYGSELNDTELNSIYQAAAEEVAVMAPPPAVEADEMPEDYAPRARMAERMLGSWLSSGGHLYRTFGSETSNQSVNIKEQTSREIVSHYMGRFYNSGGRGLRILNIDRA
jgi:hypothetical protein